MAWLAGVIKGTGFHYTPLDIILNERALPGIWDDLGVFLWQHTLIEKQIKDDRHNGHS